MCSQRFLVIFSSFLIVLGCSYIANAAEDWPSFRGPNYDGSASSTSFSPGKSGSLSVSWRAPGGSGYSGITVAEGKAVTAFTDGKNDVIVAYDSKSGKELWRLPISPIYKGHDGSHDGPIATPVIHQGKVIALSAFGDLTAIDLNSGKKVWSIDITKEGGKSPFYGYSASPIATGGIVVLQMGGEKGKSLAGFDIQTGKMKWSVGDDVVHYQSPVLMNIGGKDQIISVSGKKLSVVDPVNGQIILDYEHGGDPETIYVPVPLDGGRLLLRNKADSADLVRLSDGADGKITIEKLWTAGIFKNSYNPPVYYKGHLYGFNGRILTCVNAENGETKWKSRGVGDGFIALVNGYLVIQTKSGPLHIGPANPDGWQESNKVDLFKEISWTPPSFADGAIFSRSHGEIARLDWGTAVVSASATNNSFSIPDGSQFGKLIKQIENASDKNAAIDQFFSSYKQFPIVEWPDHVIFVYRGAGNDIAIAGDIQGQQREEAMQRVAETDLFYYVSRLEPDARVNYRFVRNFEELIADPLNPRTTADRRGNKLSWFGMPAWQEPSHIQEPPQNKRGRFESQEIKSTKKPNALAKVDVYLPAGYDSSKDAYPVLYIMDGKLAKEHGSIQNSLENLNGTLLQPVILVFLTEIKTNDAERTTNIQQTKETSNYFAEEIVPFIDGKYRTLKDRQNRALAGTLEGGGDAFYIAFENSNLFGAVATQSVWVTDVEKELKPLITSPQEKPMRIYMDWGAYDARSKSDGWDLRESNRNFHAYLKEKGYMPSGGETHEGYGWASWRNRNDRVLASLFPRM